MNDRKRATIRALSRRVARSDDSGATLIIALLFTTVVALAIAAVLSYVDTSLRTTVAVRGEANAAAAADGAAQVAVNTIRDGNYSGDTGQQCFTGGGSLPLPGYYPSGGGYSATVVCNKDGGDSVDGGGGLPIGGGNRPGQAILTLGKTAADGLNATLGGNDVLQIHGDVYSNSSIAVKKNMTVSGNITAVGTCTAQSGGTMKDADGTLDTNPKGPKCSGAAVLSDPNYAPPAPPSDTKAHDLPTCPTDGSHAYTFLPGVYTDLNGLKGLLNGGKKGCQANVLWFTPGVYYFDLGGEWTIPTGYVIGGTPTNMTALKAGNPTVPTACQTPIAPDPVPAGGWTPPGPNAGVEFVFGGSSRITVTGDAQVELCGTYSKSTPPIVLYGLKSPLGTAPNYVVPAQTGSDCVTQAVGSGGCAVLDTTQAPSNKLYIQGTTYVPQDWVNIDLNNRTGQVFRYGIIARRLDISATGSADLSGPVIEVPDTVFVGPSLTVVNLDVYVCAGAVACDTSSGRPQLRVRVGIGDPNGSATPGQRQVSVYSWSVQRT